MKMDLGKIKITWKGNYDENVQYEKDDAVFYRNSSYIFVAKDIATGISPAEYKSNSTWDLMACGFLEMSNPGEIIFRGLKGNEVLAAGSEGSILTSGGSNKNITWEPVKGQNAIVQTLPNMHCHSGGNDSYGVIMADGTIRLWGKNNYGQLGFGTLDSADVRDNPIVPMWNIGDLKIIKWEHFGYNNICLLSDGSVFCWGYNKYGCLGLGTSRMYLSPQKVQFPDNVKIVDFSLGQDAGSGELNHSMFLSDDGRLFAVGYNASGQLGINIWNNQSTPYALSKTGWSFVLCLGGANAQTLAIDQDNNLWVWGYTASKSRIASKKSTPQRVTLPNLCKQISATYNGHTLALLKDGRVYSWGANAYGQLGLGHTKYVSSPQYISELGSDNARVWAWGRDNGASIVQKQDGTIWLFGSNSNGQLGGCTSSSHFFLKSRKQTTPYKLHVSWDVGTIKQILPIGEIGGKLSLCILLEDGTIMVTGYNNRNNMNLGSATFLGDFCELKMMKHKPIALCAIGRGEYCSFGVLTDNGLYYQSSRGSASRMHFRPIHF